MIIKKIKKILKNIKIDIIHNCTFFYRLRIIGEMNRNLMELHII